MRNNLPLLVAPELVAAFPIASAVKAANSCSATQLQTRTAPCAEYTRG